MNKYKILMVSPEIVPFAKTGGLADVAGSLSYFLAQHGHDIKLLMPYHKVMRGKFTPKLIFDKYEIYLNSEKIEVKIYELTYKNTKAYFVEHEMYNRDYLYGTPQGDYPDNDKRFSVFAEVATRLPLSLNWKADIIHVHDWQSALVPILLKHSYNLPVAYRKTKTLLTIHNLGYQGLFPSESMKAINVPSSEFNMNSLEFYGQVNYLKSGIVHANAINTVSKKYSEEIQTTEYGCGLDGILRARKADLHGILNGIDNDEWNPAIDKFLPENYDLENIDGKKICKEVILKEFGVGRDHFNKPLFGMISRLASQKGFDLILESIEKIAKMDLAIVILGTGDKNYEDAFQKVSSKYDNIKVKVMFDGKLAHQIEAGSDFFLMPSKYEPCGLSQMHSLRYGTIPVVRSTGGLDDSIIDIDEAKGEGTGIKFKDYKSEVMLSSIKKALLLYSDKKQMQKIIRNAMKQDFSWNNSARHYEELYSKILKHG